VAGPDAASDAGRRLTAEETYEDAGRFYAERLGAFLPGAPRVTMKLAPGAGGLRAAGLLRAAPPDGTTVALLGPRAVFEPLIRPRAAPWRAGDLQWIGARLRDDDVCVARADAGATSMADLRKKPLFAASLAPGSRGHVYANALNELAGAKLKIVSGYGSGFEAERALATGEAQVWCGWSRNALRYRHEDLARDGRVRVVARFSVDDGGADDPASAVESTSNADDRAAMRAVASQTRFGAFALAAPPATPAPLVEALRGAFLAMAGDPETLRLAALRGVDVDPAPGAELQALAAELDALPAAARARLADALCERMER
jgi:hypothetical protein